MIKSKPAKLGNGTMVNYSQLHLQPHRKDRSAPPGLHRLDGAPKHLTTPALVPGARHVTKPSHEWAHGAPLDTEVMQKNWHGKQVPVHSGMKPSDQRGHDGDGFAILQSASRLGRKA